MSLSTLEALSIQVHTMTKKKKIPGNDKKQIGDMMASQLWNSGHIKKWEMTHTVKEGNEVNLL